MTFKISRTMRIINVWFRSRVDTYSVNILTNKLKLTKINLTEILLYYNFVITILIIDKEIFIFLHSGKIKNIHIKN